MLQVSHSRECIQQKCWRRMTRRATSRYPITQPTSRSPRQMEGFQLCIYHSLRDRYTCTATSDSKLLTSATWIRQIVWRCYDMLFGLTATLAKCYSFERVDDDLDGSGNSSSVVMSSRRAQSCIEKLALIEVLLAWSLA